MTIGEHVTEFAGKQVLDWDRSVGIVNPATTAYRISVEWDDPEEWPEQFADFLHDDNVSKVTALVVGPWDTEHGNSSQSVVEAIVSAREKLPVLKAIFVGDITFEENEISWIVQSDVSPLLEAYPALEQLRVRGGTSLSLGTLQHDHLKTLIVETGGLDARIVREVMGAKLLALEHLELWLGTTHYGGNCTIDDLNPLMKGDLFPKLSYLGLCDSDIETQIASAIARSPLLERLEVLDLSRGILEDSGIQDLMQVSALLKLKKLDIHHHYLSDEVQAQLQAILQAAGVVLDASEQQKADGDWRYVAVGE